MAALGECVELHQIRALITIASSGRKRLIRLTWVKPALRRAR